MHSFLTTIKCYRGLEMAQSQLVEFTLKDVRPYMIIYSKTNYKKHEIQMYEPNAVNR